MKPFSIMLMIKNLCLTRSMDIHATRFRPFMQVIISFCVKIKVFGTSTSQIISKSSNN